LTTTGIPLTTPGAPLTTTGPPLTTNTTTTSTDPGPPPPALPRWLASGRYRVLARLGGGSFGVVHLAEDVRTGRMLAVKLERRDATNAQLEQEYRVYRRLALGAAPRGLRSGDDIPDPRDSRGGGPGPSPPGFATVRWFGAEGDYRAMVMDRLGPDLEHIFQRKGRVVSLDTVLALADQMLARVEVLHRAGYVHRDIKPENFAVGVGEDRRRLYLIDMGLAKPYRNLHTHIHRPYREGASLTGTARYASLNNHRGVEQSRRDDLISLGYVLVFLLRGSLPWQGLRANSRKLKYEKIAKVKESYGPTRLCAGLPPQLGAYLLYCTRLGYVDAPDIPYLRAEFDRLRRRGAGALD
jgi:serine/threonine protein kinase